MRQDRKCPKCDGRIFYSVTEARMSDGQSISGTTQLAFASFYTETGQSGLLGPKRARLEARIDAWICAGCGYAELYARDLTALARLVEGGAPGVALVDARPGSDGAFR